MLELKVLGSLSLTSRSEPVPAAAQQKRRIGLLALLAIGGERGISRDRLQAYLWPESPSDRSRHALDQLIYAVRRSLGKDPILAEGRDLKLDPDVIRSDKGAFTVAIGSQRWADAVAEYGGPLLDGFHLSESRELETWIDAERMRIEQQYQSALEVLARDAERKEDRTAAIVWWRKLAASDPLSSRIALELIRSLAKAGEYPAAIQHARNYQQLVRDELEIEPDPRIEEMAASLSRPRAKADPATSSPMVASASDSEPSLTDRAAEVKPRPRPRTWVTSAVVILVFAAIASLALFQRARARPAGTATSVSGAHVNPEARELYLRGINAWSNRSKDALDSAVVHFRKAIEIEPDYAEAYGGLANSYVLLGYSGYRPASAMFPKAKAAALHAIGLDSTLASPYAALGLELTWERKFAEAEAAFRKSISLDPRYATAHQWYGMLLKILGRIDEAVIETGRAAGLDPLSLQIQNTYATFLSSSGDPAAALAQYEKVVGEEPDSAWVRRNPWLLTNMSAVYAENGMMEKALAAAERSVEINPRHPRSLEALADVHIRMGHPDVARQIFARVDTTNEHYTAQLAFFYLDLGMRDSAFAAFEQVKDWPIPIMIALGGNKALEGDPRYRSLLQRLGIPRP